MNTQDQTAAYFRAMSAWRAELARWTPDDLSNVSAAFALSKLADHVAALPVDDPRLMKLVALGVGSDQELRTGEEADRYAAGIGFGRPFLDIALHVRQEQLDEWLDEFVHLLVQDRRTAGAQHLLEHAHQIRLRAQAGECRRSEPSIEGVWLVPPGEDNRAAERRWDRNAHWAVALTTEERIVVYRYYPAGHRPATLSTHRSLFEANGQLPENIRVRAANAILGPVGVDANYWMALTHAAAG
jgi:hypothetical protein